MYHKRDVPKVHMQNQNHSSFAIHVGDIFLKNLEKLPTKFEGVKNLFEFDQEVESCKWS